MSTINISLPKEQVSLIDKLVSSYGFANRSEFVRSLLRVVHFEPELISKAATFPFVSPKEKSVDKIVADFKKTKKYSSSFIKDLKEGLSQSEFFNK
ncbi:hypothetical protein COS54_02470 [Candidatus Shapirobacteria bacterium CG03_land_8_20_14_0_80_39_12]|uniref:Ribbon-helix-helix protein CopG domain-containing protein n=1 Tax=Candidatus Shapirobacteria bacterium CG03_land_8_20_14_0_80_39_12 TaxID=1974879 RepID=A0A2M7BC46_9BACT|nr:MAG: hypothetical protein COS54_02470 [Candidatus Shapirobacteria bacterium CG03_land_8_20_14_0_80_39_12]